MRGEFLVVLALGVAASCGGQTIEDEPPVSHEPSNDASFDASVTPSWDAAAEPPLDASSDSFTFDVGLADASTDGSTDSAEPSVDAAHALPPPEGCEPLDEPSLACGPAQCVTASHLDYWSTEDGGCCVKARKCVFGCIAYPGGACCAVPPPACASRASRRPARV